MKTIGRFIIGMIVLSGFSLTVQAQKAYESFNTFETENDDPENGWYGGWTLGSDYETLDNVTLSQMGTYQGKSFGNSVKLLSGVGMMRTFQDDFPDAAGVSYWVSFFIQLDTPHEDLIESAHNGGFCFPNETFDKYMYIGLKWQDQSNDELWSVLSSPDWDWFDAPVPVETGVPVWLVARVDMTGDANNETLHVWINPDNTLEQLDDVESFSGPIAVDALNDGVGYAFVNCNGSSGLMEIQYDEIRVGTSWEDVRVMNADAESPKSDDALLTNYPNPFSGSTVLAYTLNKAQSVRLVVYDALGNEVAVVQDGYQPAGYQKVMFSAEGLPAGVYLCKLQTDTQTSVRSMLVR